MSATATFPPAHAMRLYAAVPGSRLSVVPGAEHWMSWCLADRVAGEIRTFADADP